MFLFNTSQQKCAKSGLESRFGTSDSDLLIHSGNELESKKKMGRGALQPGMNNWECKKH